MDTTRHDTRKQQPDVSLGKSKVCGMAESLALVCILWVLVSTLGPIIFTEVFSCFSSVSSGKPRINRYILKYVTSAL